MIGLVRYAAAVVGLGFVIMVATSWMPIPAAATLFEIVMGVGLIAGIVLGLCGIVSVLLGGATGGTQR